MEVVRTLRLTGLLPFNLQQNVEMSWKPRGLISTEHILCRELFNMGVILRTHAVGVPLVVFEMAVSKQLFEVILF